MASPSTPPVPWYRTAFFHALRPEQRERLGRLVVEKPLAKGQVLFVEGEACTGFFVLEAGQVRLWKAGPGGEESTLAVAQPGDSFAEAALFAGGAFPATAEALAPGRAAFLPGAPFLAALRGDAELCLKVIESQALWLRRLTVNLERVAAHSSSDRLLGWLKEAAAGRGAVLLEGPRRQLADRLAMSPETLSRALRALQDKGLIQVTGRRIRLLPGACDHLHSPRSPH